MGVAAVAGLSLVLAACGDKNEYVAPPPPKVSVTSPVKQDVTRYLDLTGNTASVGEIDLVARVEGFLDAINYTDGAQVKKGTQLFLIQQDTYKANLDQAKAQLASAQAQYTNAQTEYGRQSTLGQQDFSSQAVVDRSRATMEQAKAAVDEAAANVEIATINLGYTQVTAPFDGIVTRHLADVGQLVGHAEPTKLATLIQMNPIYAYFNLSENQVLRIKQALAATGRTIEQIHEIEIDIGLQNEGDEYPHKGKLDYAAPQIDPSTGTLLARAVFDNDKTELLPGLFVRVRVPVQHLPGALLVDATAIGSGQQGSYVLVLGKDNVVEQKIVTLGQLHGRLRVIESGLSADDKVIVGGIQRAVPGAKVDPEEVAPPPAPPAEAAPTVTTPSAATPPAATPAKP
ncbi:efflux RND transporter periplasmic adaptor subunit [Ancylobacter sp. A5.8]|uniref:efflux RND transporter periplasmic adaptor subunit n=1 Tax=Ancylobacter gelatini TaxID=2919920 RepID=UPI001F4D4B7C|nr:efflux RND transporter periplasmic adaptor subunit [Ancylobacter gelatini]MCJ8142641.1 efflux RND transporter periplasmic adaptor subunit [Ancylobacter gelatini]